MSLRTSIFRYHLKEFISINLDELLSIKLLQKSFIYVKVVLINEIGYKNGILKIKTKTNKIRQEKTR